MQTKILSGNILSKLLHQEIKAEVEKLSPKIGRKPGLGVVLVGDNPASRSYVKRKSNVAEKECGFLTKDSFLPQDTTAKDLSAAIQNFNEDPEIDGILLQLPLPIGLDQNKFLDQIVPEKDADGLHPYNQGLLLRKTANVVPCTPLGSMALIDLAYSDYTTDEPTFAFSDLPPVDLSGKKAVVIGRSILVGKPLQTLLLDRNCTVTQAHSRTENIEQVCQDADIVVAAVGVPKLVKGSWLKKGAVVIDVGINRTKEGKLVGDVDFNECKEVASAITPVPGGVGPMTVAMLMRNTLACYKAKD